MNVTRTWSSLCALLSHKHGNNQLQDTSIWVWKNGLEQREMELIISHQINGGWGRKDGDLGNVDKVKKV